MRNDVDASLGAAFCVLCCRLHALVVSLVLVLLRVTHNNVLITASDGTCAVHSCK